ncbi:MAG TPA: type IV pilus modification protein PilV [Gammaproteobacteria bacterium]|nr:type IV pilus modification protein PilV [Gammaproteobacteria bacterium]
MNAGARGFSLLEALIALLVIAIGLLGIASMQAASVYRTHVGALNGLASLEAQSMAARMTANPGAFPVGSSVFAYATTNAADVSSSTDCESAYCDSDAMALYDLKQWGDGLASALPDGKGAVACAGDPPQCTVTVSWLEKTMTPAAAGTAPIATRSYRLVVRP